MCSPAAKKANCILIYINQTVGNRCRSPFDTCQAASGSKSSMELFSTRNTGTYRRKALQKATKTHRGLHYTMPQEMLKELGVFRHKNSL